MPKENEHKLRSFDLDKKDRRILYELDKDGRAPMAQIAKRAGLSRQSARNRMTSLQKRGALWGFITFIDYSRLGFYCYDVWIQLKDIPEGRKSEFIAYFIGHASIEWLSECVGKWDMCASILARNSGHFYKIFNKVQEKFPEVIRDYHISFNISGTWYSRSHLMGEKAASEVLWHWEGDVEVVKIDAVDRGILGILAENARAPTKEIAKRVGVDPGTVARRVKRLEDRKVIRGYHGMSEGKMPGLERYEVLVKFVNITEKKERAIEEFCRLNPYIYLYLRAVGRWDADLVMEAKGVESLGQVLSGMREAFPGTVVDFDAIPIVKEHRQNFFPRLL